MGKARLQLSLMDRERAASLPGLPGQLCNLPPTVQISPCSNPGPPLGFITQIIHSEDTGTPVKTASEQEAILISLPMQLTLGIFRQEASSLLLKDTVKTGHPPLNGCAWGMAGLGKDNVGDVNRRRCPSA